MYSRLLAAPNTEKFFCQELMMMLRTLTLAGTAHRTKR